VCGGSGLAGRPGAGRAGSPEVALAGTHRCVLLQISHCLSWQTLQWALTAFMTRASPAKAPEVP